MDGTRFILAGSFIDGSGGDVRKNVFLAVRDTVITRIGRAEDLPRTGGAAVDDFSHCTIVPALIDCSVSLSRSPSVDEGGRLSAAEAGPEKKGAMVDRHSGYCHAHGVLGVVESEDITGLVKRRRERKVTIRTPGHDYLRINYSGNIEGEAPLFLLEHEDLCRILRLKGGKKAVVVANGRQQVAEALAAGCDAIEQGYGMGEDNLRKMAEKNVLWIPGVLRAKNGLDGAGSGGSVCCRFSQRYVAPGKAAPGAEAYWKKMLAGQLAQLRLAGQLGVTTAVGTGAGSAGILHGEAVVEEMKLFIRAGWPLAETIRCASAIGAGFFGMEELGPLAVGRKATFLIARGMGQQLPRKLSYLEGIYIDGAPSSLYHKHPGRMR